MTGKVDPAQKFKCTTAARVKTYCINLQNRKKYYRITTMQIKECRITKSDVGWFIIIITIQEEIL